MEIPSLSMWNFRASSFDQELSKAELFHLAGRASSATILESAPEILRNGNWRRLQRSLVYRLLGHMRRVSNHNVTNVGGLRPLWSFFTWLWRLGRRLRSCKLRGSAVERAA